MSHLLFIILLSEDKTNCRVIGNLICGFINFFFFDAFFFKLVFIGLIGTGLLANWTLFFAFCMVYGVTKVDGIWWIQGIWGPTYVLAWSWSESEPSPVSSRGRFLPLILLLMQFSVPETLGVYKGRDVTFLRASPFRWLKQ